MYRHLEDLQAPSSTSCLFCVVFSSFKYKINAFKKARHSGSSQSGFMVYMHLKCSPHLTLYSMYVMHNEGYLFSLYFKRVPNTEEDKQHTMKTISSVLPQKRSQIMHTQPRSANNVTLRGSLYRFDEPIGICLHIRYTKRSRG